MIILRQKQYSSGLAKTLYGYEKAKDKVTTGFKKLISKDTWKKTPKLQGKGVDRLIQAGRIKRIEQQKPSITGKSDIAMKRSAVSGAKKIQNVVDTIRFGQPEDIVSMVGGSLAKHPVQTVATAGTFPATGAIVEGTLQKVKPYKKATEAAGKFYDSKLDKLVRKGTTVGIKVAKAIPQ